MIGKAIKYIRNKAGYTQEELGRLASINRTTLGNYETEFRQPTFDMIEELVNKCGYDIYFVNRKTREKFKAKDLKRKVKCTHLSRQ